MAIAFEVVLSAVFLPCQAVQPVIQRCRVYFAMRGIFF